MLAGFIFFLLIDVTNGRTSRGIFEKQLKTTTLLLRVTNNKHEVSMHLSLLAATPLLALLATTTNNKYKHNSIVYKQSILTPAELASVQKEVHTFCGNPGHIVQERSSIATQRVGGTLPQDGAVYKIFSNVNGSVRRLVNRMFGSSSSSEYSYGAATATATATAQSYHLAEEVPLEVRIYEKVGAGMAWHVDDVLYDNEPQIEVVFTLENTSNCRTMWKDVSKKEEQLMEVETDPNSILLIQAGDGGFPHCVSSLKVGKRVILKCAFVKDGSKILDNAAEVLGQFQNGVRGGGKNMKSLKQKQKQQKTKRKKR